MKNTQKSQHPAKSANATVVAPKQEVEMTILVDCDPEKAELIRRRVTRALGEACREAGLAGAYMGTSAITEKNMELQWKSAFDPATRAAGERSLAKLKQMAATGGLGHSVTH